MTKTLFATILLALLCVGYGTGCLAQASDKGDRPRFQHYVYAHRAIPGNLFSDKERALKIFDTRGQDLAEFVWMRVGKDAEEKGEKRIPKDGLQFSKESVGGAQLYVIKLPPPEAPTEAYFVAIAVKNGKVSYYTLERTICMSGSCREDPTVLGGWTEERKHLNFGPGPKPTKEDFIRALADRLR